MKLSKLIGNNINKRLEINNDILEATKSIKIKRLKVKELQKIDTLIEDIDNNELKVLALKELGIK